MWEKTNEKEMESTTLTSLQETEETTSFKLDMLLEHFKLSMFDYDIQKDTVFVQKDAMLLHGFTDYWFTEGRDYYYLENLSGRIEEIVRKSLVEFSIIKLNEAKQNTSGELIAFDTAIIYQPGNTRWVNIILKTMTDEKGIPKHIFGYCRDIQQEKKEMDRLQKIAQTDALTGFRNRIGGKMKMEEALQENRKEAHFFAVVDLNKFKEANDLFGHTFGDLILKEVTECMRKYMDRETIFCRTGGDEFLLFRHCEDSAQAMEMLSNLKKHIANRVFYKDSQFDVSASIGFSIYPIHGTGYEELYDKADMAMYYAKKNCLDEPALFEEGMDVLESDSRRE